MTINDDEFALAIKNDTSKNNEINNMITDIYIENNNNKKKSNLKATSMFDPQSNGTKPKLNVSFNNDNGKRKLPFNSIDKLESTNKQTLNKIQLNYSLMKNFSTYVNYYMYIVLLYLYLKTYFNIRVYLRILF